MKNDIVYCSVTPLVGAPTSFRILPAGRFRSGDGRPEGVAGWYLDAAIAAQLIQQADASVNDYVIDYEHQSLHAKENGKPVPAAGWFKKLEWREGDGLYAIDVRWTDTAAQMLKAKEYRYISPVFTYGQTGDIIRLFSAAVTNTPALDGLTDLAAATRLTVLAALGQVDADRENAVLKAHFGPSAALVSEVREAVDALGTSDAAISEVERQQVNENLTTLFGKDAALI